MTSKYRFSNYCIAIVAVIFLFVSQQQIFVEGNKLDNLRYQEKLLRIAAQIQKDPKLRAEWEKNRAIVEKREIEVPPPVFTCDVSDKSPTIPTNVNELRPGDIKVVAAFGDSITGGNGLGARTLVEVAVPNRGEVWSIGGDRTLEEGVVTLPNIMKKFNPQLKGYSLCASGEGSEFRSWFNVASPGDKADDFYDQAVYLINRMQNDSKVNYTEDWKLITMFVGGNDLCGSCRGHPTADEYYEYFRNATRTLMSSMPRTIVNYVSMFDVSPLQNMSTGLACDLLQWGFCDCARNWTTLPALRQLQLDFSLKLDELAEDPEFDRDDFTVIHQPHMRDMTPPIDPETGEYMLGFLSPDCFHPTRVAHQGFAVWLWNALLTPVGHKPNTTDSSIFEVPIECPTKDRPYIFTRRNSEGVSWPPPTTPPTPSTGPPSISGAPKIVPNLHTLSALIMVSLITTLFGLKIDDYPQ